MRLRGQEAEGGFQKRFPQQSLVVEEAVGRQSLAVTKRLAAVEGRADAVGAAQTAPRQAHACPPHGPATHGNPLTSPMVRWTPDWSRSSPGGRRSVMALAGALLVRHGPQGARHGPVWAPGASRLTSGGWRLTTGGWSAAPPANVTGIARFSFVRGFLYTFARVPRAHAPDRANVPEQALGGLAWSLRRCRRSQYCHKAMGLDLRIALVHRTAVGECHAEASPVETMGESSHYARTARYFGDTDPDKSPEDQTA